MALICRILLLLAVIGVSPARAGSPSGAEPLRDAGMPASSAEAFAMEFVLRRSTAGLYSVFGSTVPENEAAVYLRRGVYRRELLILYDMAEGSGTPLRDLVRKREKGASLRDLAEETGSDIMKLFREAAALQGEIEAVLSTVALSSAAVPGGAVAEKASVPSGGGHGR